MTEERPRGSLAVPPAPVEGSRRGGRAALAVAVVVVGAIAVAVGLAQVGRDATPRRTGAPSAAVEASAAPSAPAPVTPVPSNLPLPVTTPPRLTVPELVAAVRDGSLDHRLVFVDGAVRATKRRCESLAQGPAGCVDLFIDGLGLDVWQADSAIPWAGDPPRGAWLVTMVRSGGLVYLGSLVPGAPLPIRQVPPDADPATAGTLHQAEGWLVVDPVHSCPFIGPDATPCPAPSPFLAEAAPRPDGVLTSDAGARVDVARGPGLDPSATVTEGVFLVTQEAGRSPSWLVVARYVPADAVRVLVP